MRHSFKVLLKTSATAIIAVALLGPSASSSQTDPATTPAASPPASGNRCAGQVIGEKRANWNSDNYLCEIIGELLNDDMTPRGLLGGVEQKIDLPRGAFLTKVHVFHDDKRVYGIKYSYQLRAGPNDDESQTAVIGGTSGQESIVELTYQTPLHFVRPRFAADPTGYYNTPVMVGLDIGYYKFNPLSPAYVGDPTQSFSHSDMIEVKRFGAVGRGVPPVVQSEGFDVHLVQAIRGFTACVSPLDRNGRILSLGVTVSGLGVARNAPAVTLCPVVPGTLWQRQPLGPKRIVAETLGPVNPYKFVRGETDQYEFASGIYTREGDQSGVIPATIGATTSSIQDADDYRGARYSVPQSLLIDFGDTARVAFGNMVGPVNNLPLITDPAALTRNGTRFDFAYGLPGFFVGVEIETLRDKAYAFVTFETTDPNGRRLNGRYQEARLGDQTESVVAKRERDRPGVVASKESKNSLFSLGTTQTGYGYVYSGYDAASMSAFDPNPGRMAAIFAESGRFQYHLSSVRSKAVNDGLLMQSITNGHSEKTQTILTSESEVADTLSRSFAADINIRGVKAGGKYATTQARSLSRSANSMIGFATAQYNDFALMLDRPNAFLTDGFTLAARKLYQENDASVRTRLATDMINRFGTHFPQAVIFGGMGTLMTEISAESYAAKRERSESFSATVGVEIPGRIPGQGGGQPGAGSGGNAEFTQARTNTNNSGNSSSLDTASWRSRGGGGSLNAEGWNVGEGNSVPIYYDLRPLDELVEPIIMSKVIPAGELYDVARASVARRALKTAIETHFAQFPLPSTVSNKRALFKLTITGLSCDSAGGDALAGNSLFLGQGAESINRIQLMGKLSIKVSAEGRDQQQDLYDSPGITSNLKCDNTIDGSFLTKSPILTFVSNNGSAPYLNIDSALVEDDDSFTDPDDNLDGKVGQSAPTELGAARGRVLISGDMLSADDAGSNGRLQKPKVYLNYVWERLD
jgi:hypothetical protein